MVTSIDIANRALILLGGRLITSFVDSSNEAQISKTLYPSTRDYVLRAYPWASLKKRAELAELADKPISGFLHQYKAPTDSIRVLEVHSSGKVRVDKWELNGDNVLCDAKPVSIVYLDGTVPEAKWSHQLVQACVYRLASEMAYPITGNSTAQGNFSALFTQALDEARTTDSLEQSAKLIGPHKFAEVRA